MTDSPHDGALAQAARLKEIVGILTRHELMKGMSPEKLRQILEELGPTYIKLGQIMSSRPDVIPQEYCLELARLRSEVRPMPMEQVRRVVENSLGLPLEQVFDYFDQTALGSASIAQAHKARLMDGTPVVVKVQREGIRQQMSEDIALLRRACGLLRHGSGGEVIDFRQVLSEMWNVAQEEMDFSHEARNAEEFRHLNSDVAYVTCPEIFRQCTTSQVLVMEEIDGCAINDFAALEAGGYDRTEIGEKLAHNYLKQVIEDGFFHADPHAGNILVREGKIVWIDLGMMGRLTPRDQRLFGQAVSAIGRQDIAEVRSVLLTLGEPKGRVDQVRLYGDIDDMISRYGSMDMAAIDLSRVVQDLLDLCKTHRIAIPPGLSMLARGIATVEGVVAELSPGINVLGVANDIMSGELLAHIDWKKELADSGRAVLASGRKALDLPSLLADSLRMGMRGQMKTNMELSSSRELNELLRGVVDRVVIGLLIAGLLVASALLCTTNMQPQLLGIPALGALGFVSSLVLFVKLAYNMYHDSHKRE